MAPHSSTFAWKIPWTEEPGRLQSMGSLRVGHDWATSLSLFTFTHWRRKWQPTPVFLPGESQGRGEPGGLLSMGSHRVGHDWSDLAAVAAFFTLLYHSLQNVRMGHHSDYTVVLWFDFRIYIVVLQKDSDFPQKQELLDLFSSVLYECVTQETPEMLPAYIAMDQVWFRKPVLILMSIIQYFK